MDGSCGGFERKDPETQPVEKRKVVRKTAEERLAEMDVRLDESGEQNSVGQVAVARLPPSPVMVRGELVAASEPLRFFLTR